MDNTTNWWTPCDYIDARCHYWQPYNSKFPLKNCFPIGIGAKPQNLTLHWRPSKTLFLIRSNAKCGLFSHAHFVNAMAFAITCLSVAIAYLSTAITYILVVITCPWNHRPLQSPTLQLHTSTIACLCNCLPLQRECLAHEKVRRTCD